MKAMSKQTAVEWLVDELRNHIAQGTLDAIAISKLKMQAKEMEREQMIDFAQMWQDLPIEKYDCKEDLYNQTYK
jgi:ASC-1-like (ASCH) protein